MCLACENTVTVFHIAIDDQWFLQTHARGKAGELALLANIILHGFVVVVIGLAAHLKIEDERIDGIGIGCIAGLDGTLSSGTEGDVRSFARRIVRPEEEIALFVGVMGVVIDGFRRGQTARPWSTLPDHRVLSWWYLGYG